MSKNWGIYGFWCTLWVLITMPPRNSLVYEVKSAGEWAGGAAGEDDRSRGQKERLVAFRCFRVFVFFFFVFPLVL